MNNHALANFPNVQLFVRFPFWGGFNAQKSGGEGYNYRCDKQHE